MKDFSYLFIICLSMFIIQSCNDDNTNQNQVNDVINAVQSGTWKITYFNDSGNNETAHFAGYSFTFQSNGIVSAVSASNTVTGTWNVTSSSSSNSSGNKFNLDFGEVVPFDDLNDDWDIQENSSTVIKLMDVSGGSGQIDYLTFEKN